LAGVKLGVTYRDSCLLNIFKFGFSLRRNLRSWRKLVWIIICGL